MTAGFPPTRRSGRSLPILLILLGDWVLSADLTRQPCAATGTSSTVNTRQITLFAPAGLSGKTLKRDRKNQQQARRTGHPPDRRPTTPAIGSARKPLTGAAASGV